MVLSREAVKTYFQKTPEFHLISEIYQKKIINFFIEERHYAVDVADVRFVLEGATGAVAFDTFDDVKFFSEQHQIIGIIGCNPHFETLDEMMKWMTKVSNLTRDFNSISVCLTHVFGCDSDQKDEWYIVLVDTFP